MKRFLTFVVAYCWSQVACGETLVFYPSQWGGVSEKTPDATSTRLDYQACMGNHKEALFKMDIFGAGPTLIDGGATIKSAKLRIKSEIGGDGGLLPVVLYSRMSKSWDATPTWNEQGGSAPVDFYAPRIDVTMTTGQTREIDVTNLVKQWESSLAYGYRDSQNYGWVVKGIKYDGTAGRIFNGAAGLNDRPRLTVEFARDATPPHIAEIWALIDGTKTKTFGSSYLIPGGSGNQLRTIPLASLGAFELVFDKYIVGRNNATYFSAASKISGKQWSLTYGNNSSVFVLNEPINKPDKIVITISGLVRDLSGNKLDGDWGNPMSLDATGSQPYPSGNGAAGGDFKFYITVLPADFNHDNIVDAADLAIWQANKGLPGKKSQRNGDADGDFDVDDADFAIWQQEVGTDFRKW